MQELYSWCTHLERLQIIIRITTFLLAGHRRTSRFSQKHFCVLQRGILIQQQKVLAALKHGLLPGSRWFSEHF